jgi:hypothetical protein
MLEMGEPVRILDLAERMIRLSGHQVGTDIPIEIVGMRQGEKLDEVLTAPEEEVLTTYHPYINQLIPITAPAQRFASGIEQLRQATAERDAELVRELLFTVGVPTLVEDDLDEAPAAEAGSAEAGAAEAGSGGRTGDKRHHQPQSNGSTAASSEQVPA